MVFHWKNSAFLLWPKYNVTESKYLIWYLLYVVFCRVIVATLCFIGESTLSEEIHCVIVSVFLIGTFQNYINLSMLYAWKNIWHILGIQQLLFLFTSSYHHIIIFINKQSWSKDFPDINSLTLLHQDDYL